MAQQTRCRCWFELDGLQFGPAWCELVMEVDFGSSTQIHRWHGTFEIDPHGVRLPVRCSEGILRLEDGRSGTILFTEVKNHAQGKFSGQGALEDSPISGTGQAPS